MAFSFRDFSAALAAVVLVAGCANDVADEAEAAETSAEELTSTVGHHRFSGSGAELAAFQNKIVVTDVDSVSTYPSDPATTPGIRNGTIGWLTNQSGEAFLAGTSGNAFTRLLPEPVRGQPYRRVWSAASDGQKLFAVVLTNWSSHSLERFDAPGAAPVVISTAKAWKVVADGRWVFTMEPAAANRERQYKVVRRAYDGSDVKELGTFEDRATFLAVTDTWAATRGFVYTIPLGMDGAVAGFGDNGRFVVSGPKGDTATLAATADDLFVSDEAGIWRARAGETTATRIVDRAALGRDAGFSGWCGSRQEYGKGMAFTADAAGAHVICRSSDDQQVFLSYDRNGTLRRRVALPDTWYPLGRLVATATHFCAAQQMRYSDASKRDQLRCFAR